MLSLKRILEIENNRFRTANLDENTVFSSVVIDSRKVQPGALFVAIKGERFDGHNFADDVLKAGAAAIVVNGRKFKHFAEHGAPVIGAPNTVGAFGSIAGAWRAEHGAPVIAITGSNGKTTTKDILATLLGSKYRVVSTVANNNNHIGVPLTLLETGEDTQFVVCEVGTNHFGEVEYSARIAQPDHAAITNIGDSHLEFLLNRRGVKKEKEALLQITAERKGKDYLNIDDPFLARMVKKYPNAVTVSMKREATVRGKLLGFSETGYPQLQISFSGDDAGHKSEVITRKSVNAGKESEVITGKGGSSSRISNKGAGYNEGVSVKGEKIEITMNLYGKKNCENALLAAAIAFECGMTGEEIKKAFESVKPPKGRMNRFSFKKFDLIDDTYNANPASMKNAFEAISNDSVFKNRIVILGDMFELGKEARHHHEELVKPLVRAKVKLALLTGKNMKYLHDKLNHSGKNSLHFSSKEKLIEYLKNLDLSHSLILVKGSRGMQMETIVEFLKEEAKS